jgi:hypothetical protein
MTHSLPALLRVRATIPHSHLQHAPARREARRRRPLERKAAAAAAAAAAGTTAAGTAAGSRAGSGVGIGPAVLVPGVHAGGGELRHAAPQRVSHHGLEGVGAQPDLVVGG